MLNKQFRENLEVVRCDHRYTGYSIKGSTQNNIEYVRVAMLKDSIALFVHK